MYNIKINIAADNAVGDPLYMEDWGLKIEFEGLTLPTAYEVHFSNNPASPAKMAIGDSSGVVVPYEYTAKSGTLYGWLVFTNPSSGYTKRSFTVAITRRSPLDPPQVLPEQVTVIDTAIAALNAAIVATSANVAEAAASAENAAESATAAANSAAEAAASVEQAAEKVDEAQEAATAAATSATAASSSAATSQAAATRADFAMNAARTSAESADESAGLAQTAVEESADNAQAAAESAEQAAASKAQAATDAARAQTYATRARASANTASDKATSASNSAGAALNHANNAANSATAAEEAQTAAESAAGTAAEKAAEAGQSATDAAESAAEAQAAATEAGQIVDDVEAWALGAYATSSASGAVATVDDGAEDVPVKALTAYIVPVQDGTGDPSPDNVRPISGFTGMNITANETVYPVTWSDVAGTVYGGYFDAVTGVLTVTRAKMTIDGVTSKVSGRWGATDYGYAVYKTVENGKRTSVAVCDKFVYSKNGYALMPLYSFCGGSGAVGTWTFILPLTVTSIAEANAWFAENPTEFVCELATPITYQLSPLEIKTLKGINNFFADTGDVDAVVRADPDLHINKLIAQAVAVALETA